MECPAFKEEWAITEHQVTQGQPGVEDPMEPQVSQVLVWTEIVATLEALVSPAPTEVTDLMVSLEAMEPRVPRALWATVAFLGPMESLAALVTPVRRVPEETLVTRVTSVTRVSVG